MKGAQYAGRGRGRGRGTGDCARPPPLAYAVVIGDIERDLVARPGQADVGPEANQAVRHDAEAFARGLNAHGRVPNKETR